ncbi:RNA polymerase subunit sigma-24 [Bacillus sp. FJAT-18017]|uniref:RNA polymerase sigma factor n=1 Tax=Bacillus sp. FJAT-18017 TaxID=1705566 RepID=UPI0006AFC67C|nr:RNA polymerase sigma factor [Bacillus sp. FJAT-18017]ALC91845.1 RNA polymerase subunit sigma-24 [Bacillus sp. FJAT-18017]
MVEDEINDWFDQYHQTIFKYIFMLTKDYQQSEDLTQETFLKAYKHYESFNRNSNEKTWLFSIAHNLSVDYLRKQKPLRLIKELFQPQVDHRQLPENIVYLKESSREIYDALSATKESQREVIILRKIKGFSTSETAEILNCSEGKVKSALHRGMLSLEKQLKKQEDYHEHTN